MNPISNQMFSDDYQRFVLQNQVCHVVNQDVRIQPAPFDLKSEKSAKTKKDLKKQKQTEREEKEKKEKKPFQQ
jgi:hypothetical protein